MDKAALIDKGLNDRLWPFAGITLYIGKSGSEFFYQKKQTWFVVRIVSSKLHNTSKLIAYFSYLQEPNYIA